MFVDENELVRNMSGDEPLKIIENLYNYVTKRDLSELTRLLDLDLTGAKFAAAFNFLCTQNKIKCRIIYGVTKMRQSYLPGLKFFCFFFPRLIFRLRFYAGDFIKCKYRS